MDKKVIKEDNDSHRQKRKMEKATLLIKRLKTDEHHFDLTYKNVFCPTNWIKLIDDLVIKFNKLTLTEVKDAITIEKPESDSEQNEDIDVLERIVNNFSEDLYTKPIDDNSVNNSTPIESVIPNTEESKNNDNIELTVSISFKEVKIKQQQIGTTSPEFNYQKHDDKKLEKENESLRLIKETFQLDSERESSPNTVTINSQKGIAKAKNQDQPSKKRCDINEHKKIANELQYNKTSSNYSPLQNKSTKQKPNTSPTQQDIAAKHGLRHYHHHHYHLNYHHSQLPEGSYNRRIDSPTPKSNIIKVFPNGDKLYGDGLTTPFYHLEPTWIRRRGQGHILRDSMSKLMKKSSNDTNGKKRERTENERARQRRRRLANGLREWNLRPRTRKPFLDRSKYQVIKEQMEYAKQHHLNIICIDVEMITLYDEPNKCANKSLWITILNTEGHLLYESLVKYPQNDIKQLNTRFHGVELHHIKYAIGDNQNRETCLDYLCCCDIIVGCNLKSDLNSLSLTTLDIMKLSHKLVDIGTAFNPRIDERIQFGLKYYSYLLFELNDFQRKKHSPTSDAIMTLWIYYYTMAQEETGLKCGKGQPTIISRLYIASLLNTFIIEKKKWPIHYYKKKKTTPDNDEYPILRKSHLNLT